MNDSNTTTPITIECDLEDDYGYDLIPMYRTLFGISCVTVPLGILFNIVFIIAIIFQAKKVFNVNSHALLLSCLVQIFLTALQGPIRIYFYYHNGCLPVAGTPLCQLTVYLDYIPTQINNFLVVQLSIERLFIVIKPFAFHRHRHHPTYSSAICLHYIGLFVAIVFPCLYYPIIMQNGASTIDLDDPSATQTCDLWYARDIYEIFDTLITFVPYFLVLTSCLAVISVFLWRKYVRGGHQARQQSTRNQRRVLLSLHLFLLWFVLTWSPWVLYDFFQTVLNLTYSVYIDAITTFVVYLNYTFSSSIVLLTIQEMRQFCFEKLGLQRGVVKPNNRVGPSRIAGSIRTIDPTQPIAPTRTVRYMSADRRVVIITQQK